jgi:hypothetical protein
MVTRPRRGRGRSQFARRDPLRYAAFADELRTHERRPPSWRFLSRNRRCFGQFPARCFVAAGRALQEHPVLLELQQAVMSVKATICLSHQIKNIRDEIVLRHHPPTAPLTARERNPLARLAGRSRGTRLLTSTPFGSGEVQDACRELSPNSSLNTFETQRLFSAVSFDRRGFREGQIRHWLDARQGAA